MTDQVAAGELQTIRSAVAPLLGEPRIAAPLTSQLLAGEVVSILECRGDWRLVRGPDEYEGWTHRGYLANHLGDEATWPRSLECRVRTADGATRLLPLGARVAPGSLILSGNAVEAADHTARFPRTATAIAESAETLFEGASYLWGGVTPWGCDCSGFVQRLFAWHGVRLPRDAWQQERLGDLHATATLTGHAPGDLLFFSDREDRRVTHVGIALRDARMIHSSLTRGGVTVEALTSDDSYVERLRTQCVAVRRYL